MRPLMPLLLGAETPITDNRSQFVSEASYLRRSGRRFITPSDESSGARSRVGRGRATSARAVRGDATNATALADLSRIGGLRVVVAALGGLPVGDGRHRDVPGPRTPRDRGSRCVSRSAGALGAPAAPAAGPTGRVRGVGGGAVAGGTGTSPGDRPGGCGRAGGSGRSGGCGRTSACRLGACGRT